MAPFMFPSMIKELCNRCAKPVYPTDKVGPLKDATFFHHGCFKCYICGTRLALKTYCNNRNNIDDREVYCNNHVPNPNPHDLPPAMSKPKSGSKIGAHHYVATTTAAANGGSSAAKKSLNGDAGLQDMKIAHAMKATQVMKPYPKIKHEGAKYIVDYDAQTRLELMHRKDEDDLYNRFHENRKRELNEFEEETKEEWEKALADFARRYEKGLASQQGRNDLLRQLTLKRDKKLETLTLRRKERERHQTTELVEQQAREMMELFRQARTDMKNQIETDENHNHIYDANANHANGAISNLNGKNGARSMTTINDHYDKRNNGQYYNGQQQHYEKNQRHYRSEQNHHDHHYYRNGGGGVEAEFEEDEAHASAPSSALPSYPATPPPPLPPSCSKRHVYTDTNVFSEIDQIAASVAQSEVSTFTDLVRTLTAGARSDVDKARAIFKWITVKNLNVMVFDEDTLKDTPMGLLRGIKYGTESYHVLFKRLCSYAGLHCVVIKGYSKSAGYQPGVCFDDGAKFRNTWNAVYLDGSWRFVQCNWGARHLVNTKEPASRTTTLSSAQDADTFNGRDGNLRYEYDDHYFMTDPEEFIYEFFPQQSEWQLLPRPITLRQFEQLPFVRSLFFRYGLRFTDARLPAVLRTDKSGAATISIASASTSSTMLSPIAQTSSLTSSGSSSSGYGGDDYAHDAASATNSINRRSAFDNLIFHYNLRFYDSDETDVDGLSLKRFVMQSAIITTTSAKSSGAQQRQAAVLFRVHTPSVRPLLLDIFCNSVSPNHYLTGQPIKFKSICKFKIVCESLNVIMVPLPECASGEWGPAKAVRLFGLVPLTHSDAIINCEQYCEIRFRMLKPLAEFIVTLHKNRCETRHLQRCCRTSVHGDEVVINLEFPDEGQYGLDVYTRDATQRNVNGKQLLTHCCKYLINARVE